MRVEAITDRYRITISRRGTPTAGKIFRVKQKIIAAWEMHAARRTLLLGDLLCVRVTAGVTVRSEATRHVLASMLLVELVAILDDALAIVLRGSGKPGKKNRGFTLKKRINHAASSGLVADPEPLHAVRRRRDAVVHDYATIPWPELHTHELVVAQHLRSWGLINGEPELELSIEPGDWERLDGQWRRSSWIGVRDAAGARAWGWQLAELRKHEDGVDAKDAAPVGTQESALEWYAASTLAALDVSE